MAAFPAPMPPDVARQQESPEAARSVFEANGLDQGGSQQGMQALQQVAQHIKGLDSWAQQAKVLLDQFDPSLSVLLQPIAQAGLDLMKALEEKSKRSGMARGSPEVPPNAPPNPAAGPPNLAGM